MLRKLKLKQKNDFLKQKRVVLAKEKKLFLS